MMGGVDVKHRKWALAAIALALVILTCFVGWYVKTEPETDLSQTEVPVVAEPHVSLFPDKEYDTDTPHHMQTVTITRPDIMIYTGPGYDYADIGTLAQIGTYTVTEEEKDREGILWGCLSSGDGWVDLDKAAQEPPHIPLTMEIDRGDKLEGREYREHIVTDSAYTQRLLFRAYESLSDIRISMMDIVADGIICGEPLYILDCLDEGQQLVIGVVFFGDLTTYGLSFADASGMEHHYMLYTSGRNGSVVMQAYTPTDK